jgi:excisionase family DNA binding protein
MTRRRIPIPLQRHKPLEARKILSANAASVLLNLTRSTVDGLIQTGRLATLDTGRTHPRIPMWSIEEYLRSATKQPQPRQGE